MEPQRNAAEGVTVIVFVIVFVGIGNVFFTL